jgi:N-methylhydantoinase A
VDAAAVNEVIQRFHQLHQQLYAHCHLDKPVEFVSARVAAIGTMSAPRMQTFELQSRAVKSDERRPVFFNETGAYEDTAIYERASLSPGATLSGPAVVEQIDTTTLIHPGQRARVDEFGNLLISIGG